jgi:hypothetical protein
MQSERMSYEQDPAADSWQSLLPLQVGLCAVVTGLAMWATRQAQHGLRLAHWMRRGPRPRHVTQLDQMDVVWWALLGVIYVAVLLTYAAAVWVVRRAYQASRHRKN